jgi:ankyrin repeat protein
LDDRVDRDNTENFPLARYAAEHWPTHARFANASLWIKDAMKCLFDATKPHFAAWLWIYNEDHWATGCSMSTMCPEEPEAVPLYYAARLGFRDLAEHLIDEHPEHVNARGGWEFTPMHVAARAGHANILSLLLEHGADAEGPGMNGQSPLHLTSAGGKLEAGRCLLDRGADINFRIENDWTPLFRAVHQGHIEFARMLLDRGARINARDVPNSWTPLHWAVVSGDIQAVRLLLEHGADVNASGKLGITPSSLASQRGISELLDQYGAKCF